MSDIDPIFTVEESTLDVVKKPGLSPWLILASVLLVLTFVLGWRRSRAKNKRSQPAVPTAELPA